MFGQLEPLNKIESPENITISIFPNQTFEIDCLLGNALACLSLPGFASRKSCDCIIPLHPCKCVNIILHRCLAVGIGFEKYFDTKKLTCLCLLLRYNWWRLEWNSPLMIFLILWVAMGELKPNMYLTFEDLKMQPDPCLCKIRTRHLDFYFSATNTFLGYRNIHNLKRISKFCEAQQQFECMNKFLYHKKKFHSDLSCVGILWRNSLPCGPTIASPGPGPVNHVIVRSAIGAAEPRPLLACKWQRRGADFTVKLG